MIRCTECEQIEGRWREANEQEREEYALEPGEEMKVCMHCGAVGSEQYIPEHDAFEDR